MKIEPRELTQKVTVQSFLATLDYGCSEFGAEFLTLCPIFEEKLADFGAKKCHVGNIFYVHLQTETILWLGSGLSLASEVMKALLLPVSKTREDDKPESRWGIHLGIYETSHPTPS